MHELIYLEDAEDHRKCKAAIEKEYPTAIITDASDYIHEHRFEVDCKVANGTFYRFAIEEGFAFCCFGFSLLEYTNPKLLKKWLTQVNEKLKARDLLAAMGAKGE